MFVGSENQAEIVDESIKHAKEAIALDVTDGNSWCKILRRLSDFLNYWRENQAEIMCTNNKKCIGELLLADLSACL